MKNIFKRLVMKQKFLLLAVVFTFTSCVKDVSVYQPIDISRFDFFEEVEIPAPASGMLSVVTSKDSGDTLMISRVAAPLEKGIFEDIEISYVPAVRTRAASEYLLPEGVMTVWNKKYMVMFEDTENGDNDYNDCVFWVKTEKEGSTNIGLRLKKVTVYPVALGSSDATVIDFGMVLPDESERKVSNVRKELFKSQKGFINTESPDAETDEFKAKELLEEAVVGNEINGVRFFIEVNDKRIYAAYCGTDGYSGVNVSKNGMPCGIVLSQPKEYPQEKVSINTVYPSFDKWLRGESKKPFDKAEGQYVQWESD